MSLIIAGTGHRPNKLGGYSKRVYQRLVDLAKAALESRRPDRVISGMALGWDMALAEAALLLNIPLVAAVPFTGQETAWPTESQEQYRSILEQANERVVVCEGGYAAWKMQVRNKYMVDHCDLLLALWDGSKGGTGNCVDYARQVERAILNLWSSWQRYSRV